MKPNEKIGPFVILKPLSARGTLQRDLAAYLPDESSDSAGRLNLKPRSFVELITLDDQATEEERARFIEALERVVEIKHPELPIWVDRGDEPPYLASVAQLGVSLGDVLPRSLKRARLIPLPHALKICSLISGVSRFLSSHGLSLEQLSVDSVWMSYEGQLTLQGLHDLSVDEEPSLSQLWVSRLTEIFFQIFCQKMPQGEEELSSALNRVKGPPALKSWLTALINEPPESVLALDEALNDLIKATKLDASEEMLGIYLQSLYQFEKVSQDKERQRLLLRATSARPLGLSMSTPVDDFEGDGDLTNAPPRLANVHDNVTIAPSAGPTELELALKAELSAEPEPELDLSGADDVMSFQPAVDVSFSVEPEPEPEPELEPEPEPEPERSPYEPLRTLDIINSADEDFNDIEVSAAAPIRQTPAVISAKMKLDSEDTIATPDPVMPRRPIGPMLFAIAFVGALIGAAYLLSNPPAEFSEGYKQSQIDPQESGSTSTKKPEPEPIKEALKRYTLKSFPSGAHVYVDGALQSSTTPVELSLASDRPHTLILAHPKHHTLKVDLDSGEAPAEMFVLTPGEAPPATVSLKIESPISKRRAPIEVRLNEELVKRPKKFTVGSGAPVVIRVSQEGAQTNTIIAQLNPGETIRQEIKLSPLKSAKPTIFLEASKGQMSFEKERLDGAREELPIKGLMMLPITSTEPLSFTGRLEGHQSELWRLQPSMHQSYTLRFGALKEGKGRLRIVGSSDFKVTLDGQPLGALTFDQDQLSTGAHVMQLKNEKDNISFTINPIVYQSQWVIWELKRSKREWRLIHYGVKPSK